MVYGTKTLFRSVMQHYMITRQVFFPSLHFVSRDKNQAEMNVIYFESLRTHADEN